MKNTILVMLGCLILLASCTTLKEETSDCQVNYHETIVCNNAEIYFEELLTDSRCPIDATCVWAGEIGLQFLVDGEKVELYLSPNTETKPSRKSTERYAIELLSVEPSPRAGVEIEVKNYIAHLKVEEN